MFCRSFLSGKFKFVSGKCQGILFFPFCMNPATPPPPYLEFCLCFSVRDLDSLVFLLSKLCEEEQVNEPAFKVNGYIFRGSNSAIVIFASLLNLGQTLKGKNLLLEEQILSFKSWPHFKSAISS